MGVPIAFDPIKFKTATRSQWEAAAPAWHRWGRFLGEWLGPATERMLELAGVTTGSRVLDVAAGGEACRSLRPRPGDGHLADDP